MARACGHKAPKAKNCIPCYNHLNYLNWKVEHYAPYMKKRKKLEKAALTASK
jgi:hypothetical protein